MGCHSSRHNAERHSVEVLWRLFKWHHVSSQKYREFYYVINMATHARQKTIVWRDVATQAAARVFVSSRVQLCGTRVAQVAWGTCVFTSHTHTPLLIKRDLYTDIIFLFDFLHHLIFNETRRFGSRLCFLLQARKAPKLVDPLDRAILSQ